MSKSLPPLVIRVLTAGAVGTVGAVLLGSLLWLGADAAGVSYEVDGSPNITMRAVFTSLAVVGLVATALALVLAKYRNGALYFGGACILGFLVSIVSPITLAQDMSTAATLVAHHVLGAVLVAVPLLRALGPQQSDGIF
jgi:hypothetical protein